MNIYKILTILKITKGSKPKLTELELENAQKRVWNVLAIDLDSTINPVHTSEKKRNRLISWAPLLLGISTLGIVAAFIIIPTIKPNTQQNTTVNFEELASKRLETVTAGLPAQELQTLSKSLSNASPSGEMKVAVNDKSAEDRLAEAIKQNELTNKNLGYYHEQVVTVYSDMFGLFGAAKVPGSSYVLTTQFSPVYYYSKTTTNNKITDLYAQNSNTNLSYKGGKYAVKTVFSTENIFLPLNSEFSESNYEVSFLKFLLTDTNVKRLGQQTIDGQEFYIFEMRNSSIDDAEGKSITNDYLTKFYVKVSDFALYKLEVYTNDKLSLSVITTKYYPFEADKVDIRQAEEEIRNLNAEIKTIDAGNIKESTSINFDGISKSEFEKKYDVIVPVDATTPTYYSINDWMYMNEATKLTENKDYDPNYDQSYSVNSFASIASYSSEKVYVQILNDYPEDANDNTGITNKKVQINIDNEQVDGIYSTFVYKSEASDKLTAMPISETVGTLRFKYKNVVYEFTDNYGADKYFTGKDSFNFKKI